MHLGGDAEKEASRHAHAHGLVFSPRSWILTAAVITVVANFYVNSTAVPLLVKSNKIIAASVYFPEQ